jgi:carboxyl-terminal processing protease
MQNKTKKILIAIIIFITFTAGILVGMFFQVQNFVKGDNGNVEITKVVDLYSKTRSSKVSFDQFWDIWKKIQDNHYDKPLDEVSMFYGAIEGMVNAIDDPYTVYFPPEDAQQFAADLSGEFEGIGAEIGLRDDQLVIIAPLPGSPAEQAGLLAGDKVYAIDGDDTYGITLEAAVSKIKGPQGSEVVLAVSHNGFETLEEISITRDVINIPTIIFEMKENNVAYVRISFINEDTWTEFDKVIKELSEKNINKMILDLRSNPGGYLETSVDIASEWIERGVVVSEKYSDGEEKEHKSRGKHRLANMNTVVLVDEGTASGSEIIAGALQDYEIAQLVGMKTFGKGSVQEFEVLLDGSALKITTAKWFTPNDRQIDHEGIEPDVVLEKMFEETEDDKKYKDLGIAKALELLK